MNPKSHMKMATPRFTFDPHVGLSNPGSMNIETPSQKLTKPLHCSQLANYLWVLKHNNTKYKMGWKILKSTNSEFKPVNMCTLCTLKSLHVATADKRKILNKRNELVTQCPLYPKEYF